MDGGRDSRENMQRFVSLRFLTNYQSRIGLVPIEPCVLPYSIQYIK